MKVSEEQNCSACGFCAIAFSLPASPKNITYKLEDIQFLLFQKYKK